MNIKNNKKSQQSIFKIKSSIQMLIKEDSHKLTIKDICNKASINRTTFYAHFDNIEDCLYDMCNEQALGIFKIFLNTSLPYSERIKQSLVIIKENNKFFEYSFKHLHNLEGFVIELLEHNWNNLTNFTDYEKAKLSLSFIISGFIGIGKTYFEDLKSNKTKKISINEFADLICSLINFNNKFMPII